MGIKICPQCSGKVSDLRNDCPHCNYNFTMNKKCPDCEEQVDISLDECPVCGHIFAKTTSDIILSQSEQVTVDSPIMQSMQDDGELACPYCYSRESMQIGNDLYMCTVCKSKFLDTRGLPTPQLSVKQVASVRSADIVTEESVDSNSKLISSDNSNAKDENKSASEELVVNEKRQKTICTTQTILSIAALLTLIVGIGFLIFTRYWSYFTGTLNSYIKQAIAGDMWGPGLTFASTVVLFITLLIQFYFEISGTMSFKKTLILAPIAIAFNTVAVFYAFYSLPAENAGLLVFAILASTSLLFTFARLVLTILCKVIFKVDATRENGKKSLALILSLLLFCCVFGGATAKELIVKNEAVCHLGYSESGYYAILDAYFGNEKDIVLPETYKGYDITVIGDGAFADNKNITSIVIPDSVTSIGDSAFSNCSSLTSITISDNVTSIGRYAFYGCSNLMSITIPDRVTSIGEDAFSSCTALEEIYFNAVNMNNLDSGSDVFSNAGKNGDGIKVVIGKNVTKIPEYIFDTYNYESSYSSYIISVEFEDGSVCESIGAYAFDNCTNLTSVVIPDSVTSIGSSAFYGCTALEEIFFNAINILNSDSYVFSNAGKNGDGIKVVIGKNVTKIPEYIFYSSKIISVEFEDGSVCESIGAHAFDGCTGLTSVTIGNSVTGIGWSAFSNCSSLTNVYYKGTASDWENISIGSYNTKLTNATRYYYSVSRPTTTGNYWHYDTNGKVVVW